MKLLRTLFLYVLLLFLTLLVAIVLVRDEIQRTTSQYIYPDVQSLPSRDIGLVLGAQVFPGHIPSVALANRLNTAAAVYKEGKVTHLLMSGDGRSRYYDEVKTMQEYSKKIGVPEDAILKDAAGLRTYDSCYRAEDSLRDKKMVIITQYDHLLRAVYTCRALGMDAVGIVAPEFSTHEPWKYKYWSYKLREQGALMLAWLDTQILHPNP